MISGWFILVFGCCIAATGCLGVTTDSDEKAMKLLHKYGYLSDEDLTNGMPKTAAIRIRAISDFQIIAKLPMTGELNDQTYEMMNMPRCGMADMDSTREKRKKRYSVTTPWPKMDLTWSVLNRTPDLRTSSQVDSILESALTIWSEVSGLTFTKESTANADILVRFIPATTPEHGDGAENAFDGRGNVLAHAFFPSVRNPIGGDAHFDDAEYYTHQDNAGINLFQVAAHEFGHSLGLEHSDVLDALMYPYYRGYVPNFALHSDDIRGIRRLYGENVGQPEQMETPAPPDDDMCINTRVTIATRTADGSTYFSNGTHVFRRNGNTLPAGYPRPIGDEFPGLPEYPDAALFNPANLKTYFFKGSQFWRYYNLELDSGFPRRISSYWTGLPNDLSAAFIWSGNDRIYFIKGNQYYRVTFNVNGGTGVEGVVDQLYPRPLAVWRGLPDRIDAALRYSNSRTYFFDGVDYVRFDDANFRVDTGYPRNTPIVWLGCRPGQLGLDLTTPAAGNDASVNMTSMMAMLVSIFATFIDFL